MKIHLYTWFIYLQVHIIDWYPSFFSNESFESSLKNILANACIPGHKHAPIALEINLKLKYVIAFHMEIVVNRTPRDKEANIFVTIHTQF